MSTATAPVTDLPGLLHLGAVNLAFTTRHSAKDLIKAARTLQDNGVPDPLTALRDLAGWSLGNIAWAAEGVVQALVNYRVEQQRIAAAHRHAWSGPSRAERRYFGAEHWRMVPSALDAGYHRRYRSKQGRR